MVHLGTMVIANTICIKDSICIVPESELTCIAAEQLKKKGKKRKNTNGTDDACDLECWSETMHVYVTILLF